MERGKKNKENKNTCEYKRESCFKSCQKMVVQISFPLNLLLKISTPYIASNLFLIQLIEPTSLKKNLLN